MQCLEADFYQTCGDEEANGIKISGYFERDLYSPAIESKESLSFYKDFERSKQVFILKEAKKPNDYNTEKETGKPYIIQNT